MKFRSYALNSLLISDTFCTRLCCLYFVQRHKFFMQGNVMNFLQFLNFLNFCLIANTMYTYWFSSDIIDLVERAHFAVECFKQ